MDLQNQTPLKAKLPVVVHNYPAHKPHLNGRYAVKDGQEILSGQVCSVVKNATAGRLEFIRGVDVDVDAGGADVKNTKGELLFIAHGNSTDGDVLNTGLLTAFSSVGGFELSTAHFDAGKTYEAGDLLVPDGLTGNLIPLPADTDGFTETNDEAIDTFVMARVVKDYAPPVDFKPTYTPNAGTANATSPGVSGGSFQVGRRFGAASLSMLRIELLEPRPVTVAAPL